MSPSLVAIHKAAGSDGIVDDLRELVKRAWRFLETAELSMMQGLAALRELRETLIVIAKATGELEPSRNTSAISFVQSTEYIGIKTVVLQFAEQLTPELRGDLARRLKEADEKLGDVS